MAEERWKLDDQAARDEWILSSLARQASLVQELADRARDATDESSACLGWWGAQRQAHYQRSLRSRLLAIGVRDRWEREIVHHRELLERTCDEAQAALAAADGGIAAQA
ncbi:MAG: hypothetical protein ACR2G7_08390 [Acidimicrobiales bacterium]